MDLHDSLVKRFLGQPVHMAGELRTILPESIVARADWSALRAIPGNFVDQELKKKHTDLLFSVPIMGRDVLLYVLFEHQSTGDAWMVFRLLKYIVRIYEQFLRDYPDAEVLPVILPVVLAHGERPWSEAKTFVELLALDSDLEDALRPYIPDFCFILDDLSEEPDEALRRRAMTAAARTVLFALARVRFSRDFGIRLRAWADILSEMIADPHGLEDLETIFRYIFEVQDGLGLQDLAQILDDVGPEVREVMVSAASRLREEGREEGRKEGREEGRQEGREQGRVEGRAELLLKLIAARFGEPSDEVRRRVLAGDDTTLDGWAESILTAESLDDVFR